MTTHRRGTVAAQYACTSSAPWRIMPRHSRSRPGSKPGVSTNVTIGTLKLSHHATKRAALRDASMSSVPARCCGWFATTPIGRPSRRASPVTRFGACCARSSRNELVVDDVGDDRPDVVGRSRPVGHRRRGRRRTRDRADRRLRAAAGRRGDGRGGTRGCRAARRARRRSSSTTSVATPLSRACTPAEPRSSRADVDAGELGDGVGPGDVCERVPVMTTMSKRPSASAGPETHAPVTASSVGTAPETPRDLARQPSPRVQRGDVLAQLGAGRVELADERDARARPRAAPPARPSRRRARRSRRDAFRPRCGTTSLAGRRSSRTDADAAASAWRVDRRRGHDGRREDQRDVVAAEPERVRQRGLRCERTGRRRARRRGGCRRRAARGSPSAARAPLRRARTAGDRFGCAGRADEVAGDALRRRDRRRRRRRRPCGSLRLRPRRSAGSTCRAR